MIIGTITVLLLVFGGAAGFSFESLLPSFEAAVHDDSRVDQIDSILAGADSDLAAFKDQVTGQLANSLMAVHLNYNSTREDFQSVFDEADAARTRFQNQLIESRFRIRALMTADEWTAYRAALKEAAGTD